MNTLRELLDVAIQGEINSQKLYQQGVDIAQTPEIKAFFEQLVKEENMHENMLSNIKSTELYNLDVPVDDPELFETTLNSHGSTQLAFNPSWSTEQIFEVALKREFMAMKRYQKAAESTPNDELISLFNGLSKEEGNHHRTIQKRYNQIKGISEKEM